MDKTDNRNLFHGSIFILKSLNLGGEREFGEGIKYLWEKDGRNRLYPFTCHHLKYKDTWACPRRTTLDSEKGEEAGAGESLKEWL